MIKQKEINDKALRWGVHPNTVDKDYALGHFLNAFYSFEENKKLFVFKGETCLRKCYFPDYRFSEDLDFTLIDSNFKINQKFLKKIADECTRGSDILFGDVKIKSKIIHDNTQHISEFIIPFWGANHSKSSLLAPQERWITQIELDFSSSEKIYTPIEHKTIFHQYSDEILLKNHIPVYSIKEILIEKIRSFEQRKYKSARDYYDVWYIMQNVDFESWKGIGSLLQSKCVEKIITINPNIFEDMDRKEKLQNSWESSLKNQLKKLPEFESVWSYLRDNLFQKLKLK